MRILRKSKKAVWAVALGLLGGFAVAAQAGVVIQQQERDLDGGKPGFQQTLYIDAGKLRTEMGRAESKNIMIFDEAKQVVWMIDPQEGSYREMDQASMQALHQQMDQAMKQMQEHMAQMPPEQRKMMEDMMKQRMGGQGMPSPPNYTVQEKGTGEKVGSFVTTHYAVLDDGQLRYEVWAAPLSALNLRSADFETFRALSKFFTTMNPLGQAQGSWAVGQLEQIKGFPVKYRFYQGGKATSELEVTKAEQRALDSNLFTLPAGLKKMEMGPMGGGRGPRQ